jgi:hypothetical protein
MSSGIVAVIIVIAVIVVVALGTGILYDSRRRRLRQRFGPEYDRLVDERDSRLKAEAELAAREKRVKSLEIRPLNPAAQARYGKEWSAIQERFVDEPGQAVAEAQHLVMAVMNDRGYPTEGNDQVAADLSVDHANTLNHYRSATTISRRAAEGAADTESLRQAMIHYRALFQDLLGTPGEPQAAQVTDQVAPEPHVPEPPSSEPRVSEPQLSGPEMTEPEIAGQQPPQQQRDGEPVVTAGPAAAEPAAQAREDDAAAEMPPRSS